MKKLCFTIMFSLAVVVTTFSQGMWGINMKVYQTRGDFNKNVEAVPIGLSFNYLYHIKDSKFSLGLEAGIAMYANNQYNFEMPSGKVIKVDEEDCFWTVHADARYFFYQIPAMKAYGQGRLGLTTFFSTIMPIEESTGFKESAEIHGTAFNFGLGGGVLINFGGLFNKDKVQSNVNLDLGVSWHSGTSTDYRYMREGSQSTTLNDGTYQSVTNYVDYRIGVLFNPRWRN